MFGAFSNSPPWSTSLLPRSWVCIYTNIYIYIYIYKSVVLLCVGEFQFDPMVLYLVEPAGVFSVVQSFVINLHHAVK